MPAEGGALRRLVRGLLQLVVALVLLALALEAALQLAAVAVRATGRPDPGSWLTERHRVLTLGDSNTYGLWVQPEASYPKVFERLWNADAARTPIEVLNLGFPGTNSSKVRHDFPRLLRTFRPDTVLLMIGANDYWTVRTEEVDDERPLARVVRFAWRYSRLYRLLYIARRAIAGEPALRVETGLIDGFRRGEGTARFGDETFELGWAQRTGMTTSLAAIEQEGRADVLAIAEEASREGVRLVLVTYPSEMQLYGAANARMRALAKEHGLPLVDLGVRFRAECPDKACTTYFLADQHPNVAGYARAAEMLVEALGTSGGL